MVGSVVGAGIGDVLDVGIGSKLGLSNKLQVSGEVYKIKKNTDGGWLTSSTVDATSNSNGYWNSTIDVSTGGAIGAGDDFTIWYRSNLNLIEGSG